jgi:predicted acetyltransferase
VSVRVRVTQALAAERPVLENLLQLYLHDFSEVFGNAPEPDGRFRYERLPLYFADPDRTPFLLRADDRLAGFALVSRGSLVTGSREVMDVSEFFVVRGLRRRGVGRAAAGALFRCFPGRWEVRALERNPGAAEFWADAIASHTQGAFERFTWESEPDMQWQVFRFEHRDRATKR